MLKITIEMRERLSAPLPKEAVSPHPTKTFLSSIKSIYVAERLNDVFGVGTWTLKGELIERVDKFVVVKAVLEIPEYGFYGEAYGGNDNNDIGDAYKGAVTDGFTKIAGQQLEIGIDVFKGKLSSDNNPKSTTTGDSNKKEHWCEEHQTNYFMRGRMKSYAHPIEGTEPVVWCHEHKEKVAEIVDNAEQTQQEAQQTTSPPEQVESDTPDYLSMSFKDAGEFKTACLKYFKLDNQAIMKEVPEYDLSKPNQRVKAWECIVGVYGSKPKE